MSKYERGQGLEIVFNVIKDFVKNNGYPPSVREIGEVCGFTSPATVQYYLDRLENKGYISKGNGRNRAIKIIKEVK